MSEEAIQESGSQEVASDTSTVSFHDTLPENLRTSPSMLKFKDVSGLAQGYVNLEQAFGGDKVAKPTDSWTDEQYNDFYAQIGRPEDINGYHYLLKKLVVQIKILPKNTAVILIP